MASIIVLILSKNPYKISQKRPKMSPFHMLFRRNSSVTFRIGPSGMRNMGALSQNKYTELINLHLSERDPSIFLEDVIIQKTQQKP